MVDLTAPTSVGYGMGPTYSGNPRSITLAEYNTSKAIRLAGTTTDGTSIPNMSSYWSSGDWANLQSAGLNGIQYFPGHSQWNTILNYVDTTSYYDENWRRDLTCAFHWWFVDNYMAPVVVSGFLVGFNMLPGQHVLRFRSGGQYTMEGGIQFGYLFPQSFNGAFLSAYYISQWISSTLGPTPIFDLTSTTKPSGTHILFPHMPMFVMKNLEIVGNNAIIQRSSRTKSDPIFDSFYATVTPGSTLLTNVVRSDEFTAL